MLETVANFGTGLGLAAGAGLNAYAVLLVYGGIAHLFPEDFPGTIAVDIQTTLAYLTQVAVSVARHGFTHILIVNGHGSNHSICDLAARDCVIKTGMICASTTVNAAVDPSLRYRF